MKVLQKISKRQVNQWLDNENSKLNHLYDDFPDREPKMYNSNEDALEALRDEKDRVLSDYIARTGRRKLPPEECLEIFSQVIAFVIIPGPTVSVAIYDYDKNLYSFSNDFLTMCIVELLGIASRSTIDTFLVSLIGKSKYASIYYPLPTYKIAVGNGIFNMLTKTLEPFSPKYTVLTKIATNYNPNAVQPKFENDDFTFEKMCDDFANHHPKRRRLLDQINSSIITGINISPALFIILGKGGDGKSTYFQMIANVLGIENVAYVNFTDMNSPDKMLECLNKKLMLGLDNDSNVYIKKTAIIKSMSTHETLTYTRKYLPAVSAPFTPAVVQLCNHMPRMAESGNSMKRRLISFKAENSYYAQGTDNTKVNDVYIKDRRFLEYVLKSILDKGVYYSDFNDIDKEIVNASLDNEDILGQFVAELDQIGVLKGSNEKLPTAHLYAAYQDWVILNNAGSKSSMYGSRGFTQAMQEKLSDYGYTMQSKQLNARPSSMEDEGSYSRLTFDSYKDGDKFRAIVESNSPSKYFVKTGPIIERGEVSRRDHEIQNIEYFNIKTAIYRYITESLKENIVYESEEFDDISTEPSDDTKIEHVKIINEHQTNHDLRLIYKDKSKMEAYINDFENINTESDEAKERLIKNRDYISLIAFEENDPLLAGYSLQIESKTDLDDLKDSILNILELLKNKSYGDEND